MTALADVGPGERRLHRRSAVTRDDVLGAVGVVHLAARRGVRGVRRAAAAAALVRAQEGLVLGMLLGVMHNGAASRVHVAHGHVVGSESSGAHARERGKSAERERERLHGVKMCRETTK